MKKPFLFTLLCLMASLLAAQPLVTRTVTMYKNGRSLLVKSGNLPVREGRYRTDQLPDALFGTYWIGSPTDELASVFTRLDSITVENGGANDQLGFLKSLIGQSVRLWVTLGWNSPAEVVEGQVEKIIPSREGNFLVILRTAGGKWITIAPGNIMKMELTSEPRLTAKRATTFLELIFKNNKPEQEVTALYLTDSLGWIPIYRLDLNARGKSRLALRAEIANDAEDLGAAELRLAVGIPNFAQAKGPDWLVDFRQIWQSSGRGSNDMRFSNAYQTQVAFDAETYEERLEMVPVEGGGENFSAAQAEDFFFYTVRPGDLPRYSRLQFPIFETEIEPAHFYECVLPPAGPSSISSYQNSQAKEVNRHPVFHYIEFENKTAYPWTTGAVNILSQDGTTIYPVSQDLLPYTAPKARCKVKIAQTPEIKIAHGEGDVERNENAKRYFSRSFDQVKLEGQVSVINYKKDTVRLKIRRTVEGQPTASDMPWKLVQEQATLRVNSRYEVEWEVELKPGEEKKWKYSYEVFVDL